MISIIKLRLQSFYNSWIKKLLSRNTLFIELTIIFFIVGIFVGVAFADGPKKPQAVKRVYDEQKVRVQAKNLFDSTTTSTTTTTTTTKPVVLYKKPAKTTSTTTVPTPETNVPPVTQAPAVSGDWVAQCHIWAAQAGIELNSEAILLIDRESDCSPTVLNPSSKAGGIPQALPFSKTGCALIRTDEAAVCQLKWMHGYVFGKYGGWAEANRFWECIGYCSYKTGVVKNKTATWY